MSNIFKRLFKQSILRTNLKLRISATKLFSQIIYLNIRIKDLKRISSLACTQTRIKKCFLINEVKYFI